MIEAQCHSCSQIVTAQSGTENSISLKNTIPPMFSSKSLKRKTVTSGPIKVSVGKTANLKVNRLPAIYPLHACYLQDQVNLYQFLLI